MAFLQRIGILPALFYSSPEDVPSIHKKSGKAADVGKELAKVGIKCTQVILEAVGGPVGGKLASVVLVATTDQLFQDLNMDMKQLLSQIKQTVHDELTEVELDKIQGTVEGLQRWVRIDLQSRMMKWEKKEIWVAFNVEINKLRRDIDLLMESRFKGSYKGLTLFVIAASLHLAVLQDLARVDFREKNWKDSVHINDMKKRAIEYAEYAETGNEFIMNERATKVIVKRSVPIPGPLPIVNHNIIISGYREITQKTHRWEDETTEQYGDWFKEEETGYDERVEAVKERLHTDMGKPVDVARQWRAMATAYK